MTVEELCLKINLQEEIQKEVLKFIDSFDFEIIKSYLDNLKIRECEELARFSIKEKLGEDERQIKMLSCMFICAVEAYDYYIQKGISENIYIDTMKCFTRFIDECKEITGEYAFDREWWTSRQVGCELFRIGQLEFEMKYKNEKPVISIHIPSDADISDNLCDNSLKEAKGFFRNYFPEYKDCEYICHSWLLAPEIKQILSPESNIIKFQNRFKIVEVDYQDMQFIRWIFKAKNTDYEYLLEETTLQKSVKGLLISGKKIGNGLGILK